MTALLMAWLVLGAGGEPGRADEPEPCQGPCSVCGCMNNGTCNEFGYCEYGQGLDVTIAIPAGSFPMGTEADDINPGYWPECWGPVHQVYLDAYTIDRYQVSLSEFIEFIELHGISSPEGEPYLMAPDPLHCDPAGLGEVQFSTIHERLGLYLDELGVFIPDGRGKYPATPTWWGARDYCLWRGKGICTEAQWERAARGPAGHEWPWGGEWVPQSEDLLNGGEIYFSTGSQAFDNEHSADGYIWLAPVNKFPKGRALGSGAQQMSGNGGEWVHDLWSCSYYQEEEAWLNPKGPCNGSLPCPDVDEDVRRIQKGGNFCGIKDLVRTGYREGIHPGHFATFRCCGEAAQ